MNKFVLILSLLFSFALAPLCAQPKPSVDRQAEMEKIREMKVAFFTRKIDITPSQAEKFWALYNEYNGNMDRLRRMQGKTLFHGEDIDAMSDAQATAELSKILDADMEFQKLRMKMFVALGSVLSDKQKLKLVRTEMEFSRYLFEQMKKKNGD